MDYVHPMRALIVGICVGLSGLCVSITFGAFDSAISLSAFVGAFVAGILTAPLFGRRGDAGYGWAMLGAACATVLGGALGAVIYENEFDIFTMGAILIPLMILSDPISAAIWLISMSLTQFVAGSMTEMACLDESR